MTNSEIVRLNVGGTKYITANSTLQKYPQSMLGAMFRENFPLLTDEDGYYFIDRCGHIFQYILQFLRCGRLVLPEEFNELELLQLEADFYQIEDLISAVEDRKKEVKVKETDDAHVLVFAIICFKNSRGRYDDFIKVFIKSKESDFKFVDHDLILSRENEVRNYLQNDGWVLKQQQTLGKDGARIFFTVRGIDKDKVFHVNADQSIYFSCSSINVETWLRNPDISF